MINVSSFGKMEISRYVKLMSRLVSSSVKFIIWVQDLAEDILRDRISTERTDGIIFFLQRVVLSMATM
jgi:hypothetical protein